MRKTLSAAVLVLAFCCPTWAGVIHNPPPAQPPLPGEVVTETVDADTVGVETTSPGWSDSLTQAALDLLAVLPALL